MFLFVVITRIPAIANVVRRVYRVKIKGLQREVFGLQFNNPIGLAAGFDKDGKYIRALSCLGFGFIEVGTVTPRPQSGNPRPRLFRLKASRALINRMGFNNEGVEKLAKRLAKVQHRDVILGANIGKNKDTPNERAVDDYVICFERLFPLVDYFVVNVSSPNTPNLRDLQEKEPLTALITELQKRNHQKKHPKPILLKIAPDLSSSQLDDIIEIARITGLAGLIATNTTISREGLVESQDVIGEIGAGGLSGAPLKARAVEVVHHIHSADSEIPLIGVGGICNAEDAMDMMNHGASLVQLYTGFIYNGPGIVKRILRGM